jgi:hypothetical protein
VSYSSNETCGDPIYFKRANQTIDHLPLCYGTDTCVIGFCEAQYYLGLVDTEGNIVSDFTNKERRCCLSHQIKVPSIDGGRLSLSQINVETVSSATELLNAGCIDQFGVHEPFDTSQDDMFVSFFNVIGGAYSDALGGACGLCPSHTPYCDAETKECRNITCADVKPYCLEDSLVGVRSRQFCPLTCGCANPAEDLILHGADFGCPETCSDYYNYDQAVDALGSCEDVSNSSLAMKDYVEEVKRLSTGWPGFWGDEWRATVGPLLKEFGCSAVSSLLDSADSPQDLCVFGGTMWPVKPISYLCPQACECSTKMMWGCPSSCAVNATAV